MKLWVRCISASLIFATGCAGAKKAPDFQLNADDLKDASRLIANACDLGKKATRVDGVVSMKVKSPESSGQFPADVAADATGKLRMEITNLIGGTEAIISVDQGHYKIEIPGKPEQTEKGSGVWGGIPLRWAPDLFLGRIPCPKGPNAPQNSPKIATQSLVKPGTVKLVTEGGIHGDPETYLYQWNLKAPAPFPESLIWERSGQFGQKVEFKFEEFDPESQGPKKWEAKSNQGEVKVRWKSRKIK